MVEDHTLLQHYTSQAGNSRQALEELIRKHLELVYSAALRQVRDAHLAEDVTQAVFLILAQRAGEIRDGVAVAGWLLAVTRTTAVNAMRKRIHDRGHERAVAKPEQGVVADAPWEEIAPVLDGAMSRLPQQDRDAVVLRVLENQSLAQVGAELGISQEAAGKRVGRALSRLRKLLRGRGVTIGAAALSVVLAERAVHAAPAHLLSGTLAATATGTASASVLALVQSGLSAMAMQTARMVAAMALTLVAFVVFGVTFFGREPAQGANAARPPGGGAVVSRAKFPPAERPESVLPSAFATDDWFTGSNFDAAAPRVTAADPIASGSGGNRYLELRSGSTVPHGLGSDAGGNVYAAGRTWDDSGALHGIVREKRRGDAQWRTILDTGPLTVGVFGGLGTATSGGLYMGLYSSRDGGWYVYFRPPGQEAFQDEPVDHLPSNQPGYIAGFAADDVGNVYVAGEMAAHWIVRKQTRGVGAFTTVDDFTADSSLTGRPLMVEGITAVHGTGPSAGIYVCGRCSQRAGGGTGTQTHWIVRRSRDGGRSWETVDDYRPNDGGDSWKAHRAQALCADARGDVYVTGAGGALNSPAPDPNHWITRRSASGDPGTWTVDDDFVLAPDYPFAVGHAITADRTGNVYAAGVAAGESGSACHALIRTNAGGYWHTIDDFNPEPNRAGWTELAVDEEGRLWAAGWVQGPNPGWIVRSAMLADLLHDVPELVTSPRSSPPAARTEMAGNQK
jgi:RNA polymerase sigma factor (sigma-70 family)